MATKRTFSLEFLQHPPYLTLTDHLKALYFALMSLADDDGFLYLSDSLLRQINAKKSDISRLSSQNLLHLFDNKIAVILHWRVHNTIQKDRYTPTIYIKERQQLCLDNRKIYRILTGGLDTNNPKKTTSEEKRREEKRREYKRVVVRKVAMATNFSHHHHKKRKAKKSPPLPQRA